MNPIQRLKDLARERRIKRLAGLAVNALERGQYSDYASYWFAMRSEIEQRSPAQIERMERAMGVRPHA